jgi:hypothetical protein
MPNNYTGINILDHIFILGNMEDSMRLPRESDPEKKNYF